MSQISPEFHRHWYGKKPWKAPHTKPYPKRQHVVSQCMDCRVLFRNDDQWFRHADRWQHFGARTL